MIDRLYQYYSSYWMGSVYPTKFSVYRDHDRTNNAVESWNKKFNTLCGVAHGNWWNHLGVLVKSNETTCRDLEAIRAGQQITRARPLKLRRVDNMIIALWDRLDANDSPVGIEQFLEASLNFFEPDRVR